MDTSYIAEDEAHPTGTVQVTLDAAGKPSYEICEGVAWDAVPWTDALSDLAARVDAVCFGSLAQRAAVTRSTIHAFLEAMRPGALKIFDVNLRQSFYSREVIEASLSHANVLKLSDEELPVLAQMFGINGTVSDQLHALVSSFKLRALAYTRGGDGSVLLTPEGRDDHPGCPGKAVDSVGAGDSFTAALCVGLLNERPLTQINEHANRVATYVCSQSGATPVLEEKLKKWKRG